MKGKTSPEKLDRKVVERNRRIQMKGLCFKLASLVPPHYFKPSKEAASQQDQLEQAAKYIRQLKQRIEELKKMKAEANKGNDYTESNINHYREKMKTEQLGSRLLPVVELRDLGSSLQVLFVSGLKNFMLYEVINVLEDEGAEVVSASFSTVGGKDFTTLHAKVKVPRVGVDTQKVRQRLHELLL